MVLSHLTYDLLIVRTGNLLTYSHGWYVYVLKLLVLPPT